ncbi:LysM and putative peptidoglycan-binding domain-containing protein 1 [Bienertia sinuspersici]
MNVIIIVVDLLLFMIFLFATLQSILSSPEVALSRKQEQDQQEKVHHCLARTWSHLEAIMIQWWKRIQSTSVHTQQQLQGLAFYQKQALVLC